MLNVCSSMVNWCLSKLGHFSVVSRSSVMSSGDVMNWSSFMMNGYFLVSNSLMMGISDMSHWSVNLLSLVCNVRLLNFVTNGASLVMDWGCMMLNRCGVVNGSTVVNRSCVMGLSNMKLGYGMLCLYNMHWCDRVHWSCMMNRLCCLMMCRRCRGLDVFHRNGSVMWLGCLVMRYWSSSMVHRGLSLVNRSIMMHYRSRFSLFVMSDWLLEEDLPVVSEVVRISHCSSVCSLKRSVLSCLVLNVRCLFVSRVRVVQLGCFKLLMG